MSNFGKKILSKYGWKKGDGLGKEMSGICNPIQSSLKYDKAGLGFDHSKDIVSGWWHDVYNSAAKELNTLSSDLESTERMSKSTKRNSKEFGSNCLKKKYSSFRKGAVLNDDKEESLHVECEPESSTPITKLNELDDDALFAACGGRTAHRAARFGLHLSGKLARVEAQEARFRAQQNSKNCRYNDNEEEECNTPKREKPRKGCQPSGEVSSLMDESVDYQKSETVDEQESKEKKFKTFCRNMKRSAHSESEDTNLSTVNLYESVSCKKNGKKKKHKNAVEGHGDVILSTDLVLKKRDKSRNAEKVIDLTSSPKRNKKLDKCHENTLSNCDTYNSNEDSPKKRSKKRVNIKADEIVIDLTSKKRKKYH